MHECRVWLHTHTAACPSRTACPSRIYKIYSVSQSGFLHLPKGSACDRQYEVALKYTRPNKMSIFRTEACALLRLKRVPLRMILVET